MIRSQTILVPPLVLFALIAILTPACRLVDTTQVLPTVKIGLVAPFEGLHRPLGYEVLFAVKLAIQERNAGSGLAGYRVELVALNDFDDPTQAKIQAQALVADPDVLGVVGHLSSAATHAALPIYEQAELAVSVPWSIISPEKDISGVVTVTADQTQTADFLAQFMTRQGFQTHQTISSLDLPQISSDTEALTISGEGAMAGEVLLALAGTDNTLPLFGQVDVGSPQVVQVAEMAAEGLIFVSPGPNPVDLKEGQPFITAYQRLAGFSPGPRAVLAYDATHILLDALEQTIRAKKRQPTRAEVRAILPTMQRVGLTGQIAFDAQGRRIEAPIWLYQIVEGQYPGRLVIP